MSLKDLPKDERNKIAVFVRRLAMSKAVAQLCLFFGIKTLTPLQEKECLEIMKDNLERFDANKLWLDYRVAKRLQRSVIRIEMEKLEGDDLFISKYRGDYDA